MASGPEAFADLFGPAYVGYASSDVRGSLDVPPGHLVHRVHLVATPSPGLVTVCGSQEGWRFLPGGRLDPGEAVEDAIARELLEEAGSLPTGPAQTFFSHIATSRAPEPYMRHVPHPVTWWVYAVVPTRIVGLPTNPGHGEQITELHHLPAADAAAWLEQQEPSHAAVVRLAAHLKLI